MFTEPLHWQTVGVEGGPQVQLPAFQPNFGVFDAGSSSVPAQDLGQRLLETLSVLFPSVVAEASSGSEAGQELISVVQHMAMLQPNFYQAPMLAAADGLQPCIVPASSFADGVLASGTMTFSGPEALKPPDDLLIDSSDDEGVVHRLPPGFGAIPEDLVVERLRKREEERILRIKATQECRFGKRCKRRDCPNAHSDGRIIDSAWNPCAFGKRCKRKGCFYDHPEGRDMDSNPEKGLCKFGVRCSRPGCLYDHPPGHVAVGDGRVCYFCHMSGHIAANCPRNPESWAFTGQTALQ